ncbi:hypothetical protein CPLU01_15556 [Colletotrichum plurivorum]|uniref:Heterokaryon incompatibility domain-containing protein n=1 Tax=Colletotrichum plurivorum TaxID=2175906 RepID=A0A8H6MUW4_9PEZI|nr:hypothetical protein CPLU01_15556 [Colletotrichum plurivorum]
MESLCEHCSVIPLTYEDVTTKFPHAETSEWFSLGDLARVNASRCPFCCLAAQAIHELYKATRPEDGVAASRLNPVNVFWSRDAGPDGKGAFIIYGVRSCLICLATDDLDNSQATGSFCLRTVVRSKPDNPRMATWISTCAETHTVSCGPGWSTSMSFAAAYPGLHVLRLIDVDENRLIETYEILPYVALSYVWGGTAIIRLTRANLDKMLQPGSLKEAWPRLPRTIQDTIRLVRGLGLRYVWVDALCLVQNNTDDLERGVKVMDNIYEQSRLTIIAAAGHNSKAGLPGVRVNSRLQTRAVDVKQSTHLSVFVGLDPLLQSTVYQSRAWTSIPGAVALSPSVSLRGQSSLLPVPATYPVRTHLTRLPKPPIRDEQACGLAKPHTAIVAGRPGKGLRRHTGTLHRPRLNQPRRCAADVHALAGTMRRVGHKLGQEILQGLLSGEIVTFLLFRSVSGGGFSSRRHGFPSWSWAGWEQAVTFGYDDIVGNWPESQNWIVWYDKTHSGTEKLLSTSSEFRADFRSNMPSQKHIT